MLTSKHQSLTAIALCCCCAGAYACLNRAEAGALGESDQSTATTSSGIEIVALTYASGLGDVSFEVVNNSEKPVIAYGVKMTGVFADGTTKTHHLTHDFTPTLPLADKDIRPRRHLGALLVGERTDWKIGPPQKGAERPITVTVVPDFIINSDNSVIGENQIAATRIFERNRAIRDEYGRYRELLRRILGSSDVKASVSSIRDKARRASAGENSFGTPSSDYAILGPQFAQFALELKGVLRCIDGNKGTPKQCLSRYLETLESYSGAFAAHSERAGGAK